MRRAAWLCAIVTLLFINRPAFGQGDYFNSDAFWQRLQLDEAGSTPHFTKLDTAIVVASNRQTDYGKLRFMSEEKGEAVHFYFVYSSEHKWHVLPVKNLEEATGHLPNINADWVVYTEGMGKLFTTDLERGMNMGATYGVNVLLLDYPSIHTGYRPLRNYHFAIRNARVAYNDFSPVLDTLKSLREHRKAGNGHLALFFHSMGNIVFAKIATHTQLSVLNDGQWVDNLVLNAACVQQKHHSRYLSKVHFAKHSYVMYNPTDKILKVAHLAAFKRQLGEKVRKPICKDASYINFSIIAGESHNNFLSLYGRKPLSPALETQYGLLFHGATLHTEDTTLYKPTAYRHIGWDMLPHH